MAWLIFLLVLAGIIVLSARSSRMRREREINRLVLLDTDRQEWGGVVSTQSGECPQCGELAIVKVYKTGNVETHCTSCGYQAEV